MTECEGCKKLQALYKTAWGAGWQQGKLTNEAVARQAVKALETGQAKWTEERRSLQDLMTQAIEEAEGRVDHFRKLLLQKEKAE